jgi:ribonuclease VapC
MASGPRAIMDASAVVAWLLEERGARTIERLIPVSAVVSVNLAETFERLGRTDPDELAATGEDLASLGLSLLPFEAADAVFVPQVRTAGRKLATSGRGGSLSLGGCCCLAAAIRRSLPVITDDGLWPALDLGVRVHLFRG